MRKKSVFGLIILTVMIMTTACGSGGIGGYYKMTGGIMSTASICFICG